MDIFELKDQFDRPVMINTDQVRVIGIDERDKCFIGFANGSALIAKETYQELTHRLLKGDHLLGAGRHV